MYARLSWILVIGAIAFVSIDPRAARGINIIFESFDMSTHPLILNGTAGDFGTPLAEDLPSFDSDSSGLLNALQEVESVFEDAFEDSLSIRITYLWDTNTGLDSMGNTFSGQAPPGWVVLDPETGQITHAIVRFNPNRNWFIDPTPSTDGEFAMNQTLFSFGPNALSPTERLAQYTGSASVPATFEAGYQGAAVSGGPADQDMAGNNLRDLLTVAFQEVGHAIGMSSGYPDNIVLDMGNPVGGEAIDSDWDIDPDFVGGANFAIKAPGQGSTDDNGPFAHIVGNDAVMAQNLQASRTRTRPSAADFLAIAAIHGWTTVDLPRQDFLSGPNWNSAENWMGNQTPGADDISYVRHGGTIAVDVGASVASLLVDNASTVHVGTALLFADQITVQNSVDSDASLFTLTAGGTIDTDVLTVAGNGQVVMSGGQIFAEDLAVLSQGELHGFGTIDIDSIIGDFINDGIITALGNQELVIDSDNLFALDIDGINEAGVVEAVVGSLRIETGLLDPINTGMTVGPGQHIAFNGGGVVFGNSGTLFLGGNVGNPASVEGKQIQLNSGSELSAGSLGVVENVLYIGDGAEVRTADADPDSEIRLLGDTVFQGGTLAGAGTARQTGDAAFTSNTLITIDTYDMDGQIGDTTLTIDPGVTVTINSSSIDTAADNAFDGTLNNNGGTLHMEHDWTLDGTLNLTQDGSVALLTGPGRITVSTVGTVNVSGAGRIDSPITLAGTLSVGSVADLNGDTIITAAAELETNGPSDVINLNGATVIGGGSYSGGGVLRFQGDIVVNGNTSIGMSQVDLDGTGPGGSLSIAPGVTLSVASTTLDPADEDYDDTMHLRGNFSSIVPFELTGTVNMTQLEGQPAPQVDGLTGFAIRPSGQVNTDGDARINRDTTVQGALVVGEGTAQINAASIVFESTSNVIVKDGGTLELNGPTTYEGGFHSGQGLIEFNGTTNINDDTTISTARVDLDGAAENTNLNLNDSQLTLNVELIDTASIQYNGLANVVGEYAQLAVNLSGAFNAWRLMPGGQLNFSNPSPTAPTVVMLSGSPLSAEGVINAVGPLTLAADVEVKNFLNVNTAQSHVHFGGPTRSTIHANRTATVVGLGQITVDEGISLNLEDQALVAVDTTNRGRLEIGFEASELSVDYTVPATATVRGFFAQTLSGELAVDLRGTVQATRYDWLLVEGMARLSGTVEATFIDGFVPDLGDIFAILTATNGREGEFDVVEAIDENDVLGFVLTDLYTASAAMLRVDDVFLLGDYNGDGMVTMADYPVWRNMLGATGPGLAADGNGDQVVDHLDYDFWAEHLGNKFPPPGAGAAVPEPPSAVLLLVATSVFLFLSGRVAAHKGHIGEAIRE